MPLVSINDLTIGFRGPSLLDSVNAKIDAGQKIGLLGRNGAGKTTLMRMLRGEVAPDHGEIIFEQGKTVALLQQDVPQDVSDSILNIVALGWPSNKSAVAAQHVDPWVQEQAVNNIISRMELDPTARFESLSSGMKRRVLLAQALVTNPDLLLLDEPTNHLDIDAINWLEKFLNSWPGAIMFVTHDRAFLRKIATRIWEIDRGRLFDWSCDYDTFLLRKDQALHAEEKENELFDKKLAEEEVWIRQGIKARRTRNEGRVRALKEMREQRAERREKTGTANLQIQQGQRSGKLVIDAKEIAFAYDDNPIVSNFSTTIMRGDKIGILGPNGVGKTTLLRLLLGKLKPQEGSVRLGANLQVAYFDQLRAQLDETKTVQDDVGDGYDFVQIGTHKKHIIGYLQDFLFTPERARSEIRFLSGGERNRVLLAKLFAKPANLLVLDEPTNDLDAETLEMLEEKLVAYAGTIITVSHDRAFLNNVVTSTIVFENGNVKEYVGGYDDWQRQSIFSEVNVNSKNRKGEAAKGAKKVSVGKATSESGADKRKLKYAEKIELEQLPGQIQSIENQIKAIHDLMAEPGFYQQDKEMITSKQNELSSLGSDLASAYARWELLETLDS